MFKKKINASQKIILLRSFFAVMAIVLFLSPVAFSVSADNVPAEFFDPKDYAIIDYWTDNSGVTYDLYTPEMWYTTGVFRTTPENSWAHPIGTYYGYKFSFDTFLADDQGISMLIHPLGTNMTVGADVDSYYNQVKNGHIIDLTYVPKDTFFQSGFRITVSGSDIDVANISAIVILLFVDKDGYIVHRYDLKTTQDWIVEDTYMQGYYHFSGDFKDMGIPANAVGLVPYYTFKKLDVSDMSTIAVEYSPFRMGFSMGALEYESLQNDKLQNTMDDVKAALDEQGKQLEELPGQIGDEMQGVIEQEKQESQGEGNKFVDQILGALPDPSQGVLAALGDLTGAVGYTGTDAKLTIPALILPGIDGVFSEFVIWEGTEFSFGDFLGFLPPYPVDGCTKSFYYSNCSVLCV